MNTTLRTQMTTPTRSSQLTIYSSRRHLIQELDFDLSFRGNLPLTDLSKADFEGCPLLAQSGHGINILQISSASLASQISAIA